VGGGTVVNAPCLGCGGALPDAFLDLGSLPLANSLLLPQDAARPEARYPLAVAHCASCHLVQLRDRVAPPAMFSEYLYFSSFSSTFVEHARRMAEDLGQRFSLGRGARVLEVASNDGYLLEHFQRAGLAVLGVEPAANVAEQARARGVPTLVRFFGPEVVDEVRARLGAADLVVGNNVLAHVPEVNGFLAAARDCLGPAGVAVFEFPSLAVLLARTEFDTIYHEHVSYLSLLAVDGLARRAGLELFDVEGQAVHGGSLRVFLAPPGREVSARVATALERERDAGLHRPECYQGFAGRVRRLQDGLVEGLRARRRAGARIAAYGAPAKGNTLLNSSGIGRDVVEFTVDRSPHKQGRLLPGSHIPVRPVEDLLVEQPDFAVLLPWNLEVEVVAQRRDYLQRGGCFLVPVPELREVRL
jgi:SAM-dependent methyltransferase